MELQNIFYAVAIFFLILSSLVMTIMAILFYRLIKGMVLFQKSIHEKLATVSEITSKIGENKTAISFLMPIAPFAFKALRNIFKRKN